MKYLDFKNKKFYFLFFTLFLFATGCGCSSKFSCDLPLYGRRYFSAYKAGSYWIYTNKNSTIMDSVFISNFKQELVSNNSKCLEYNKSTMTLEGSKLGKLNVEISNSDACETGFFKLNNLQFDVTNTSISGANISVLSAFKFRNYPQLLPDVVSGNNKYWFVEGNGMFQFVPDNSQDTFYLLRSRVL
jgi:hypothetical protein